MPPHNDAPSPAGSFTTPSYIRAGPVHPPSYAMQYLDRYETDSASSRESMGIHRALVPGIYVPTPCFFKDNEDLDLETIGRHAVRLAEAGVQGIATQGSNGEAVMLSRAERIQVTNATRQALDDAGFGHLPIIVGCGAQSTREAIELCEEAYAAGGDYALVLPPSYYSGLHAKNTVKEFFRDLASASPIPILIYNFPPVACGIDLNSDAIIELSTHPNIIGCKLTCGNTGKLNRVAAGTRAATTTEPGTGFFCMGGSCDFTLQTMMGGGSGVIGGFANIAPKACVRLWQLLEDGQIKEARKVQAVVARGDWAAIQGGVTATKSALQSHFGYGGYARKPLPRPNKEETKRWREAFDEIVRLERSL